MRISILLPTLVLGLVPVTADAQSATSSSMAGAIDFGLRGTSVSGDAARYERYRDLGDGLALEGIRLSRERQGWLFDFTGEHVARKDQRFFGSVIRPGKFKGWAMWDQIPMLMSETTKTLFAEGSPGVLEIDNALQSQIFAAPGSFPTVFAENARQFEMKSRRHLFDSGFEYLATPELTLKGQFKRTDREGAIPYGGSFGHGSLVEMPAPIEHSLTDLDASAEFSRDRLLLRAGYTGSFFHNDVTSVIFDSPFRALDTAGNSSRGRLTLPPTSSFFGVNGTASVRLPYRSRATAYVSVGTLKDAGDPLVPLTINSTLNPAPLERTTVEGEARTTALNLSFMSRPTRLLDFNVRYRSYEYDNRTPELTLLQRVSYDNSVSNATYSGLGGQPSGVGSVHSEPFGVIRHTFDADAKATPMAGASAGIGYSMMREERSHRFFESTTDHVLRLTFDAVGNPWFSLRSKYEHGRRRANATEEEIDEAQRELFMIGEQPGIRHFDIAERNRDRVTVVGSVMPMATVSINASVAAGKDDYLESLFGLRDNTHRVLSVGMDVAPSELVTVGGSYSYEKYHALSRSRQASPPGASARFGYDAFLQFPQESNTSPEVARASRNWASDGTDRVHSFIVSAGANRIADKVDLQFSYDFNRAHALYGYITGAVPDRTLPEEVIVGPTLTPACDLPIQDSPAGLCQLPLVKSKLQRATLDATYPLTSRVSVGLSYWYERYDVTDFTLDAEANPNLARGSALLIGYLYVPYTAHTVWGRIFYRW